VVFGGRKPAKKKASVGRPAATSAAITAEGPGTGTTAVAGLARRLHQLEAGIGDERRPGVRDQRHRFAGGEALEQLRPHLRGIVLVIGDEFRRQAEMVDEPAR
jgi:hypothetical protein